MQTCREAGGRELPSKAQERRLQGCAGLGGWRPAALRPPPLAPAGCCCSRGACRIGPPKPKAGGKKRRKVARVRLGAGTIPPPTRRASCGKRRAAERRRRPPAGALPTAPGPDPGRLRRAPPEPRGSSSCSAAGARRAVTTAAPKFTEEGAMQRETEGGSASPEQGGRKAGRRKSPYLSGWADTSRAPFPGVPDRKITTKGGPGKSSGWLQDKVGGSSSTAKKTLPYRLGLFGKLQRGKCGAARVLPFPAGAAGRRKKTHFLGAPGDFCDTK